MSRPLLVLWAALASAGVCPGEDWTSKVQALRPADSGAGERSVLDRLEGRAAALLSAIRHAADMREADRARPVLREKLRASLGYERLPYPAERARVFGTVPRAGFRIEKIVLQALPGMGVPAHLYVPDGLTGRAPAVLFYPGHWWPDSKTRPDFQAFCINMARLGFVVLAWDPFGQGERGISSRDHRRVEALLVGISQQGFAEHETRAALDYLLSRPEVDPKRIGLTGASGGGYNTWITSALDDRIAVAVPVVGTSEFLEQIRVTRPLDWYRAAEHCHFVSGLLRYANNHEFVAMTAPRPLLVIAASRDQSFPIEGVREIAEYGRKIYGAYGAAEKFGFFEDSSEGHGYQNAKREAAYGWFRRWLQGTGDGSPYPEPPTATAPFDAPELQVFPPGLNRGAGPRMVEAARGLASAADSPPRAKLRLEDVLGVSGRVRARRIERPAGRVARIVVSADDGLDLPGFLIRPAGAERGLLLALDDRGKESVVEDLPVDAILERGWAVAAIDARGLGELRTTQTGWVAAVSLLLGENFVGRQALDAAHAASALAPRSLGIYARGHNAALAATYLLGLGPKVRFFILRDGFVTLRHFIERPASLEQSYRLLKEDRDRTTAFDREIPFSYVPWRGLDGPDLADLWRAAKGDGLVSDPIDGDWKPLAAEAAKLLPPSVRVVSGAAADPAMRDFLRVALR